MDRLQILELYGKNANRHSQDIRSSHRPQLGLSIVSNEQIYDKLLFEIDQILKKDGSSSSLFDMHTYTLTQKELDK